MSLTVYGLKNCDTCRKAVSELRAAGHDVTLHDVRADGLADDQRAVFLATFGDDLVNRRSTTWRGLSDEERAGDPAALLAQHPALMKRPVISHERALHLGWGKDVKSAFLG